MNQLSCFPIFFIFVRLIPGKENNSTNWPMKTNALFLALTLSAMALTASCESDEMDNDAILGTWTCKEMTVTYGDGEEITYTDKEEWVNPENSRFLPYRFEFKKDQQMTEFRSYKSEGRQRKSFVGERDIIIVDNYGLYFIRSNDGDVMVLEATPLFLEDYNYYARDGSDIPPITKLIGSYLKQ